MQLTKWASKVPYLLLLKCSMGRGIEREIGTEIERYVGRWIEGGIVRYKDRGRYR